MYLFVLLAEESNCGVIYFASECGTSLRVSTRLLLFLLVLLLSCHL